MLRLWVARNEGYDEEVFNDRYIHIDGELTVFFDKPELKYDSDKKRYKWVHAREMCVCPTYMFPEIKEETCVEFRYEEKVEKVDDSSNNKEEVQGTIFHRLV